MELFCDITLHDMYNVLKSLYINHISFVLGE